MVADFHRTLVYGGIYLYPADKIRSKGKLRYLYECAPLALLIEQAGGAAITCGYSTKTPERILDIVPYDIHQRCSIVAGCTRDIAMYRRSCVDLVISFSQDSFSSGSGSHHSSVISNMLYNQPRSSLDTVQKELEIRRSLHVEANDRKKQCNSKEDEYNNASDGLIIGGL
jgi:fructose-1,6-bisphosphatase I